MDFRYSITTTVKDSQNRVIREVKEKFEHLLGDYHSVCDNIVTSIEKEMFQDVEIDIEIFYYNSISNTWMCMASYYGAQKRLIKH